MTTTRDPAPREPGPPLVPSPPLREPSTKFMADLALAIRGGARPDQIIE
jgi:hypothetical protein